MHGKRITEEQEEDGKVPPPPKEAKLHDVEHLKEQASCSWFFSFWSPCVQGDDTQINPKVSFPRASCLGDYFNSKQLQWSFDVVCELQQRNPN